MPVTVDSSPDTEEIGWKKKLATEEVITWLAWALATMPVAEAKHRGVSTMAGVPEPA
jgi:hypothetical protein